MREESQLDEMRAAIRGDFERLARRRGDQELMRIAEPGEAAEPDQPAEPPEHPESVHPEPEHPEPEHPEPEHPEPEPAPVAETEPPASVPGLDEAVVEPPAAAEDAEPARRSWLDRLLGR